MPERIATYREFWPLYLRQHAKRGTRLLHFVGSLLALALLAAFALTGDWRWLLAALIAGYGFAWIGHFAVEKNRPATFTYPLWSIVSDFRMLFLFVTLRLGAELRRHKIDDTVRLSGAAPGRSPDSPDRRARSSHGGPGNR